MQADPEAILARLEEAAQPQNLAGMARYGIDTSNALVVKVPVLREIAREYRGRHDLALTLWKTGVHEARILASMIDDPGQVSEEQMEEWARDFASWDLCDQTCINLFRRTSLAHRKIEEWSMREEEFVKRAAFALIAALAVHDKRAADDVFRAYLPTIEREATDERNGVKKAVNWALRQIGKRNPRLNRAAVECARQIARIDSRSARWIASDALRELTNENRLERLREKET